MEIRFGQVLDKNIKETEVFFIGNVQDVIFSRAKNTVRLPPLLNGFGACGGDAPATIGESIVYRECAAATPPDQRAGLRIDYRASFEQLQSPFFVGWRGIPALVVNLVSETGITINQLYQEIFSKLREIEAAPDFEYVFLELVGLFKPEDIFDRALQKPVDRGNVLTTLPEHAKTYFKPRIIYSDLRARNFPSEKLFPLFIAGAGHTGEVSANQALCETVFYTPPENAKKKHANDAEQRKGAKVLTHNHALGWRGENSRTKELLASIAAGVQSPDDAETFETSIDELLEYAPGYLVHIDDWSVLRAASVKVFLADASRFNIEPVSEK